MEEEYAHILYCQACVACHLYQQERATRYAVKNLDQRLQMGRRDKYLGMAYLEHGVALMISDRFEEAIEAFQNSLEVYSQTPEFLSGEYRPDFPNMYLARAFCEVGRPSEAAMVVLENVRFRENKYGPNDTESKKYADSSLALCSSNSLILGLRLGLSLHTLGNARAKQGFMAEAIDAYQRAMINYKATVGNTHSSVGQVCTKLAQIYNSIGQYDSATFVMSLQLF